MTPLPANWVKAPIGDVCELFNGRAFKSSEWADSGLPIVRIQNLNRKDAGFNYYDGPIDDRFSIDNGDLLFAWSGTPGTSFGAHLWAGGRAVLNQHIYKVVFDRTLLDPIYFKYAINDTLDELIDQAHGGVGLRHVTKSTLQKTEIKLPPFLEQQRIGRVLTLYLERISTALLDLQSVAPLVTRYKAAVLTRAFTRQSSGAGRQQGFARLADLIDEGPSNGWSPKSGPNATGALTLKLTATTSGQLRLDEGAVKRIYETPPKDSRYWLLPGDLLVQRANALEHLGAAAIFDGPAFTYIYPDLMMRLRIADTDKRQYVWRYLTSDAARQYIRDHATGTAGNMPKISGETLRNVPIPLPAAADFGATVRRIDYELGFIEDVVGAADEATVLLEDLKRTILERAFSGKLATSNPNDVSARDLLVKIRTATRRDHESKRTNLRKSKQRRSKTAAEERTMGHKVRGDVDPNHLSTLLTGLGGSATSADLWRRSEMTIDEFYKQLRAEMKKGHVISGVHGELVINNAS